MVKGLRTPTRCSSTRCTPGARAAPRRFWKLRLPASVPYLFASLKIAIAASLVGTIVGELPAGAAGLGARMLAGSYYGQTVQIWAALLMAALLAAVLVWLMGWLERSDAARHGGAGVTPGWILVAALGLGRRLGPQHLARRRCGLARHR